MNASISPFKRITSTTKIDNNTFPTTSTIETDDFGHYRFFKCRPHFLKIWKNYDKRVFSRHIIDEQLNFVLEFFHQKNCIQKFLQFFSLRILCAKIPEKFTEVPLDKTKCCDFFQIFPTIIWGKKCKKRNLHNQRWLIQYGGYRVENLHKTILGQMTSNTWY